MEQTGNHSARQALATSMSAHLSARRATVRQLCHSTPTDRRASTQTALLTAGRELIANRGVAGTSVGDITSQAGFTRGAFYSNFTDMDHFVSEVARLEWHGMLENVENVLSTWSPTHSNAIDGAVEILLQVLPRDRERYLLWNEFATYEIRFPESAGSLAEDSTQFYAALVDILHAIMESFNLVPVCSLTDLVELIVALSARSTRNDIIDAGREPAQSPSATDPSPRHGSLIARLLPELIRSMTRPAS